MNPTWNCAANSCAASGRSAKCCPAPLSTKPCLRRPNSHCADGKRLHSQFQISVLIDGKPKALNIPAELVDKVRQKIEMRRRFDAAATTICKLNLKRFLQERRPPSLSRHRHRFEAYLDKVFGFSDLVSALPEGRQFPALLEEGV